MNRHKSIIALFLTVLLLLGSFGPIGEIHKALFTTAYAYGSNDIDPAFVPMWPIKGTSGINGADYYHTVLDKNEKPKPHNGVDVEAFNKDIYSVANGRVIRVAYDSSYGNNVYILHTVNGKYFVSHYAHLSSVKVKKEDRVYRNDPNNKDTIIGIMGKTGSPDIGVHLHFEIYPSDDGSDMTGSSWWKDKSTRYDRLNSTLFYYINNNPSQLVNTYMGTKPSKSFLTTSISKYCDFFNGCYKYNSKSKKYEFDPVAYVEYKRVTPISPAVKMRVNKDKAAHRTGPYEKCTVVEELKLNQEMTVVGYCINIYGNKWYKTDKGYWIYGERLSEVEVGRITFSTKKSSNTKTSKKAQITTVPAPIVQTAYGKTVIPGPAPTLDGYAFLGYSTQENAEKPEYYIGQEIDVSPNQLNLYCVWKQTKVTMALSSNQVSLDLTNNSNVKSTVKATVKGDLGKSTKKIEAYSDQTGVATVTTSNRDYNGNWLLSDILKTDINITAISPGKANVILTVNDNNGQAIVRQTVVVNVDERYQVSYYDGDTDFKKSQTKHFDKGLTLSDFIPEKDDHIRFLGWSTSKDSSVVTYGPGDVYSENHSLDLYAVWVKDPFIEHSYLDGVLTITGRGNMPSYPTGKAPWVNYKDLASKIIISSEITTIGSNAFYGFKNVTEVEIPDTVWYIGSNAFNSTLIKQVRIPSRGVKIGNRAFANCTKLIDVAFADAYSKTRAKSAAEEQQIEIGAFAFENCVSLASIDLPNSVSELGAGAFNGCSNLTAVDLPEDLKVIEDSTFFGCCSLIDVSIPDSVKVIGDSSFDGCSALPEVELPDGLTELGDRSFAGCSAIEAIELPDGVKAYGAGTFTNCSALTAVDLPKDMTQVPDAMFSGCSALKTVDLPESVEIIGDGAFRNCSALESIVFSEHVSVIGNNALQNCDEIDAVVIPASVTAIGSYAFCDCDNLKEITLNEGLTEIHAAAFAFCDSLESAAIPASVTLLDNGAFMGCSALAEVELLESPMVIGDDVFFDCSSLKGVQIPESIVSLGENVFGGCADSFTVTCFSTSSVCDQVTDTYNSVNVIYPVTGVSLSKATVALHAGDSLQLQAIIAPANATDKTVVWSTNHPEIATVDENGLVTTTNGGTVVITAMTNDNKLMAQCEITVTVPVTGIELNNNKTTAYVGESFDLGYFFAPSNPTNIGVSWSTSDDKVATVSENGEVTIVGVGNVTITATTEDGGYTSTCAITAERYIAAQEIVLEKNEITLHVGNSTTLGARVLPANATDPYLSYVLSEEYEGIIEIDESGLIKALKPGIAVVTVIAGGVEDKTCTITVITASPTQDKVKSVSVDDVTINYKSSIIIKPKIDADDGVTYTVKYESSNQKVASVDEHGNVKALKKGNATITVTVTDQYGNVAKDTCTVTVKYTFIQWIIKILLFGWIWY